MSTAPTPSHLVVRFCVIQYTCPDDGPCMFTAGWDVDPDDHQWQDEARAEAAMKLSGTPGIPASFITAVRFFDTAVPVVLRDGGTLDCSENSHLVDRTENQRGSTP